MNAQTRTLTPSLNARHSSEGWNPVTQPHSREAGMPFLQAGDDRHVPDIPATPLWIPRPSFQARGYHPALAGYHPALAGTPPEEGNWNYLGGSREHHQRATR